MCNVMVSRCAIIGLSRKGKGNHFLFRKFRLKSLLSVKHKCASYLIFFVSPKLFTCATTCSSIWYIVFFFNQYDFGSQLWGL